ncbi:hypothetical protein GGQ64_004918 [Rhizobium azooxidifex]|uniref:Uncharacterized protein n=1 Tax=Mycoplana azooxidifex TaxID=1636188 RepID=A0A7W6DBV8_9HYPH|nr:hypothetical protein [Mycoplana azooxidifex]
MGIKHLQFTPDHQLGHFTLAEAYGWPGTDHAAVTQHGDAVSERLHLIKAMGNVKNRHAVIAQHPYNVEKRRNFIIGQNRRRLVQDDDFSIVQKRACNLHELALGERQFRDTIARARRRANPCKKLCGTAVHRAVVDHQTATYLTPQKQVFRDRKVRSEQNFLVYEYDAGFFRLDRVSKLDRLAVHEQPAFRRRDVTGQQLHQRRLAGAVFTDDGVNLSRADIKRNIRQDSDLAIGFAQAIGP